MRSKARSSPVFPPPRAIYSNNPSNSLQPRQSSQSSSQQESESHQLYSPSLASTTHQSMIPRIKQNSSQGQYNQNSVWEDLVKLLQLTIVLVLIVFIFVMGYWVMYEVNQLVFGGVLEQGKGNVQTGGGNSQFVQVIDETVEQKSLQEQKSKGEKGILKSSVEGWNDEMKVGQKDDRKDDIKVGQQEVNGQSENEDQQDQDEFDEDQDYKDQQKQLQAALTNHDDDQPLTHQTIEQEIPNLPKQPSPHPTQQPPLPSSLQLTPTPSPSQLFDPVLIQLNKYKKRLGSKYKETIYTMPNTSITQDQFNRAKQLVEIMNFYDPKENRFVVKGDKAVGLSEDKDGQQREEGCGKDDPTCQKKQSHIDTILAQQHSYFHTKYGPPFTTLTYQLPFCIIIPSYNNNHNNNILKNLNSILQQNYTNFHVVYIDDASDDGTQGQVKGYIERYGVKEGKLRLVRNRVNQKALRNIYQAAHGYCKLKEIMIIVDGDDYLVGTQVLRFLNYEYQTKTLLAAYTNYLRINDPYYIKVGTSTPYPKSVIANRIFRRSPRMFRASHLRSYYVDLFRKIKLQDLQDETGQFFTAANDFAIMMPVLEMAAPHFEYLPELTYLYDAGTGLNNFQSKKKVQEKNVQITAKRKIYDQVDWKEFYTINK